MRSTRAFLTPCLIATSVGVVQAAPDAPVTLARLDVRAAVACTSQRDLAARITARSPRIRFVDDKAAFTVRAQFSTLGSGKILSELVLVASGVAPTSRRLIADSCAQAAEGIALIVAVTLDPTSIGSNTRAQTKDGASNASFDESATESPTNPSSNTIAERSDREKGDESMNPSQQKRAPAPETASTVTPLASPVPPREESGRFRVGAYVAGQSLFGPAPEWMPGIAAYFSAELDRSVVWSPLLVLGVSHAWRSGLVEWGGTASFSLDAASLDGCPLGLRWRSVQARACASVLAGILTAEGTATLNAPEPVSRPFIAVGPTAVLTAGLGSGVVLFARIGVGMNLVRDSYEFSPRVFHEVDTATASGSLGIGSRAD